MLENLLISVPKAKTYQRRVLTRGDSIMNEHVQKINDFIEGKRSEMVEILDEIVSLDSFKNNRAGCNAVAARFGELFTEEGFDCRTIDVGQPQNGNMLVGILGADRPGAPVIFGGHMDTVFETADFETPFYVADGKAFGPGVLDMKGGIVIALYTVKALHSIGWKERPIKIIFAGDEEKLHQGAPSAQYFQEECQGGFCMFNMETGMIDNALCIGRSGKTEVFVEIAGVEVHSGNDYANGRNAIWEMAHKILEFQKCTDLEKGITVNSGVVHGGTMSGAVPRHCEAYIDLRASRVSDMEGLKKKIEAICDQTFIEGTTTKMSYTMEMLPFETNDKVLGLFDFVKNVAADNGFGAMDCRKLGGASDASYATIAGVPTLCSCGARGQWNHTIREYIVVESLYERAKLWATVVCGLDKFKV